MANGVRHGRALLRLLEPATILGLEKSIGSMNVIASVERGASIATWLAASCEQQRPTTPGRIAPTASRDGS